MDILIIHWMIQPDETSREDFLNYWRRDLPIAESDRGNLVGEFLSEPHSRDDVNFPCKTFEESDEYTSFFNVAMWRSHSDFKEIVWDRFGGDKRDKFDFEVHKPERMVLSTKHWRAGEAELPDSDNC